MSAAELLDKVEAALIDASFSVPDGPYSITARDARYIAEAVIRIMRGVAQQAVGCGAKAYVESSIASFVGDPPDNQFQKGYLAALEVVRDEAFPCSLPSTHRATPGSDAHMFPRVTAPCGHSDCEFPKCDCEESK